VGVGFCGGYCVLYVVASMASIGRSVKEGNMNGCGKWFKIKQCRCYGITLNVRFWIECNEMHRCPSCVAALEAKIEDLDMAFDGATEACDKLEAEIGRLDALNAKLESALDQLRHVARRCNDTELSELIKCVTSEG